MSTPRRRIKTTTSLTSLSQIRRRNCLNISVNDLVIFYHLRNIFRIRKLPSTKTTETKPLTTKLDHCISVQNAAARLITSSRKFDRIIPVLFDLHWLPISERIKFKIILLTRKALHQQSPIYIQNRIRRYSISRTLRSSSTLRLTPVNFNLKSYG